MAICIKFQCMDLVEDLNSMEEFLKERERVCVWGDGKEVKMIKNISNQQK